MKKAILYYTDNSLSAKIATYCRSKIQEFSDGIPIVSVSWQPIDFGDRRVVIGKQQRSYHMLFAQIYIALCQCPEADMVFTCEHDVVYSKGYFDFEALDPDKFYYVYQHAYLDFQGFYSKRGEVLSQMCCSRDLLFEHTHSRLLGFAQGKYRGGYYITEPGMRDGQKAHRIIDIPCIDIRHDSNFTELQKHRYGKFRENLAPYGHYKALWAEINT